MNLSPLVSHGLPALLSLGLLIGTVAPTLAQYGKLNAPSYEMPLWTGIAPGEKGNLGEEKDTAQPDPKTGKKGDVILLGNVSKPMITVYRPDKAKDTGAAVVVCPGGGYYILAYDLEGTEVCQWLNSIGVTAVLLKYRVPRREGLEKHVAPLQDAQRALGLTRFHAKEWGIDPHRVGILGFSAGGHLTAAASTNYETRTYPPVDDADKESCRPDFSILVYPAYINGEGKKELTLAPEIKVTAHTPPAFIVQAQDDKDYVYSAYTYSIALKDAGVPVELHLYPKGGHGYGLRPTQTPVTHWPELATVWMQSQGFLKHETK